MKSWLRNTFTSGLLFGFLAIIPGCEIFCTDSCGCGPTTPPKSVEIRSFEVLTLSSDNKEVNPSETKPFDQVVKAFRINEFNLVSELPGELGFHWGLGTALACSPAPLSSKEKLIDLQVINTKEVQLGDGTTLQAGQDITELFGFKNFFQSQLISLSEFLKEPQFLYLGEFITTGFMMDPGKNIDLELDFILKLEKGKEFLIPKEVLKIGPKN
ncbi:hypothetical protein DFQ04_1162 [Algoriphagus boseongensis]|uniref:Uncharacterized protein n=1 Tax=Algoriphagus boseongensis TaxID=1442587 RepID=A0A4R6T9B3_9BACT|nr:hypothetical protein [Algoriphagus boseongensis]TDQ19341.1 hypothetical protein DFQ04_1162 [Algoriphagus boseongensis]